eukprot:364944-Chlamydomonas_euryale.AAC.17
MSARRLYEHPTAGVAASERSSTVKQCIWPVICRPGANSRFRPPRGRSQSTLFWLGERLRVLWPTSPRSCPTARAGPISSAPKKAVANPPVPQKGCLSFSFAQASPAALLPTRTAYPISCSLFCRKSATAALGVRMGSTGSGTRACALWGSCAWLDDKRGVEPGRPPRSACWKNSALFSISSAVEHAAAASVLG